MHKDIFVTTQAPENHPTPHAKPLPAELWGWLPILIGLGILYAPSLYDLFQGVWSQDEQKHGPIVLAIALWLIYRHWPRMRDASHNHTPSPLGWPIFILGLLLYILGRSQDILVFEIGSAIWLLAGALLLQHGTAALKAQWFGLFFMLFMVPLPAAIVDTVTMPMKMAVSYMAEHILFWAGYPIGRSGVILYIGQYMLLVADACAGLHTLLTLEALGLLYLNMVRRDSAFRNLALALLIVPISFTANVIRVMALTLTTYHLGDAAGQGFLHGFAGIVLFLSALLFIIGFDVLIHNAEAHYQRRNTAPGTSP
jgi:exosortase B